MSQKIFKCPKFGLTFTCEDTPVARIRTLRGRLTRNKISIFAYLQAWDIKHHELRCAWCNEHNHDIMFIEHEVVNNEIHPTQVKRRYAAPYLCFGKNPTCPSKNLNRNSKEFIAKAYGISEDEALELIHKRNKTPFYSSNHSNLEEHKRYQSRSKEWWDQQGKDRDAWIAKANYSRSMQGYLDKHGPQGEDIWKGVQQSKTISLEKFIQEYGEQEGTHRYEHWIEGTSHSLDAYIRKYGKIKGSEKYIQKWINFKYELPVHGDTITQVIERMSQIVAKNPMHEYTTFNVDKEMQHYLWYDVIKEFYQITTAEIDILLRDKLPMYKQRARKIFNNKYSCYSYSNLGTILKSRFEILVYDYLIDLGLVEEKDFRINQRYPESTLFYDLYFINQNCFVELAGDMLNPEYAQHMRFKEQNLSSIIVYRESYRTQINQILGI